MTTSRSSPSSRNAASARARWPLWGGSNVPPSSPVTSPQLEHLVADRDLVARLGPRLAESLLELVAPGGAADDAVAVVGPQDPEGRAAPCPWTIDEEVDEALGVRDHRRRRLGRAELEQRTAEVFDAGRGRARDAHDSENALVLEPECGRRRQ